MNWTSKGAILITGATRRVGLHCVRQWLAQGEQVVVTYRSERPVLKALQESGAQCLYADFSSDEGVMALIDAVKTQVGPLRALVHNASVWPKDDVDGANHTRILDEVLAVHVRAPYLLNLHLADLLRAGAQNYSDIVHITDYVVEKGSLHHIAYAASKAALANLTLSFARRYAPLIKVNTVAPSLLMFNEGDSEAYRRKTLDKSVMGIEPGPEVVADSLAYLFNNPYMTGREIRLDGGRHIR